MFDVAKTTVSAWKEAMRIGIASQRQEREYRENCEIIMKHLNKKEIGV